MFIWLMFILFVDMVFICGMVVSFLLIMLVNDIFYRLWWFYVSSVFISSIYVGSNFF